MKRIKADMILYYALSCRDAVTSKELATMHNNLLFSIDDIFIDTTRHSIQETVKEQPSLFEFVPYGDKYVVKKRNSDSRFFDIGFLDKCYAPFFKKEEYKKVKSILTSTG